MNAVRKLLKLTVLLFSLGTRLLSKNIRKDIYNIYGFVRFADEIVDSFHDFDKSLLFNEFSKDLEKALERKIHLNPILNSFQHTFHKYNIDKSYVNSFMKSMRMDLTKKNIKQLLNIKNTYMDLQMLLV